MDTSGQVLLFSTLCSGLKMDVSIEADAAVGHWFRLDDVIGATFSLGLGVDLEGESQNLRLGYIS